MGIEIAEGAFDESLKAGPIVDFLYEHDGLPMSSTHADEDVRLGLELKGKKLKYSASLDPEQADAALIHQKVGKGLLREASFSAAILDGDFAERDGEEVFVMTRGELDRGDISVVRNGANPNTTAQATAGPEPGGRTIGQRAGRSLDLRGCLIGIERQGQD